MILYLTVIVTLAVFGTLAVLYYGWRPDWNLWVDEELHGLGGLLTFVAIGVVIDPLFNAFFLGATLISVDDAKWAQMTLPGGVQYHPWWAGLLLLRAGAYSAALVCNILAAVLFFKKRRTFPMFYIACLGVGLLVACIQAAGVDYIAQTVPGIEGADTQQAGRSFAGAMIGIPYMLMSRRVRSTFVTGGPRFPG